MSSYEFSNSWFSENIPVWEKVIRQMLPNARSVLEIGSYEGQSAVWICENILRDGGTLVCVDSWKGGVEHETNLMSEVESRFVRNMSRVAEKYKNIEIIADKGPSFDVLVKLLTEGRESCFDFVYIDGSHQCSDVLSDLVLSFRLCRKGGIVACDDYLWSMESNGKEDLLNQPKLAIDSFINCYRRKLKVLSGAPLAQVYFIKTSD